MAVKISDSLIGGSLIAAPFGVSNWTNFVNQGLDASGCSNGGSGFDCVTLLPGGVLPNVGGTLVWE